MAADGDEPSPFMSKNHTFAEASAGEARFAGDGRFLKIRKLVFTPAYGWNTPAGIETTASSFVFSSKKRRISLSSLFVPKSEPSGKIMPARPLGLRELIT